MKLQQIASHDYRVLAVLDPVEGHSVLEILDDASRHYPLLFEQMVAALYRHTPTFGPPYAEKRDGVAKAKGLDRGISEFTARNWALTRRQRKKQSAAERDMGLRVFFFEYGNTIVCTNACYKTSKTPPDALPAALRICADLLAGERPEILGGD